MKRKTVMTFKQKINSLSEKWTKDWTKHLDMLGRGKKKNIYIYIYIYREREKRERERERERENTTNIQVTGSSLLLDNFVSDFRQQ